MAKIPGAHGFQAVFTRFLNEQGIQAKEVKTEYGDDELEPAEIKIEEEWYEAVCWTGNEIREQY